MIAGKKYINLLLFAFVPMFLKAQSWALFPENVHVHYETASYWDTLVYTSTPDSVVTIDDTTFTYFAYTHPDSTWYPCDALVSTMEGDLDVFPFVFNIQRSNGWEEMLFYSVNDTLYFRVNALPSETFDVGTTNDDDLYMKCLYINVESVFGVMDSIRHYRIYSSSDDTDLDEEILLSKSFGLLQFYDPTELKFHENGNTIRFYTALGIQTSDQLIGWQPPQWGSFFPMQEGDVFIWDEVMDPGIFGEVTHYYYKDSIASRTDYPDHVNIVYYKWGKSETGVISMLGSFPVDYFAKDFKALLEAPVLRVRPALFDPWNYYDNVLSIWFPNKYTISPQGSDTVSAVFYDGGGYQIDTLTCTLNETLDVGTGFSMDTKHGFNFYSYSVGDGGSYMYLVGGTMSGVEWGESDFKTVSINTWSGVQQVHVYPNPAENSVHIKLPSTIAQAEIFIYNSTGQIVMQTRLNDQDSVDVSALAPGHYFLSCRTSDNVLNGQFVKL